MYPNRVIGVSPWFNVPTQGSQSNSSKTSYEQKLTQRTGSADNSGTDNTSPADKIEKVAHR
eukprot:snap_masked-scaffold_5-processed-gene-18.39-mRNA-1 protein AED:1.00 eAED:1.00 QI:0/-1/0/0/-1/1/1/0/60